MKMCFWLKKIIWISKSNFLLHLIVTFSLQIIIWVRKFITSVRFLDEGNNNYCFCVSSWKLKKTTVKNWIQNGFIMTFPRNEEVETDEIEWNLPKRIGYLIVWQLNGSIGLSGSSENGNRTFCSNVSCVRTYGGSRVRSDSRHNHIDRSTW